MKTKSLLFAGSFAALLAASLVRAQPATPAAPVPPAATALPAAPAYTDEQLVQEFGWWMAKRVGLTDIPFTPSEADALLQGFSAAIKGAAAPYDLQKVGPAMDALMQRKQTAYLQKLKQKNSAETEAFVATLKANKAIVELPSGLRYEIVSPGTGSYPKAEDTVTVNYTGKLINGSVFDSSVSRGKPAEFALNQVIPGWTEGIQKINKGGKLKLYIPPQLGYGDEGRPGIPPGSTLIFDVELLDIKAAPVPVAPPTPAPTPAAPSAPAAQ